MQALKLYEHKVQYYETDQMQVVHHSNYIRWFEEARTDFLEQVGFGYDKLESSGVFCPVLAVSANYLRMTKFGETMRIELRIKSYNGIKMIISYQAINKETGIVHCTGESKHCFLNQKMQPVFLRKDCIEFHEMFMSCLEEEGEVDKNSPKRPEQI